MINVNVRQDDIQPQLLPVLPLPIFLLAGGVQQLRMFEPKHLSLVAKAAGGSGFVITPCSKGGQCNASECGWGTHVKIVDFGMGDDGILTVDVLGDRMVTLTNVQLQRGGMLVAQAETFPHWSCNHDSWHSRHHNIDSASQIHDSLSSILKALFNKNEELSKLYQTQYFNYAEWVYARLLEIVPLSLHEKEKFVHHFEFSQLETLLGSLCKK